MDSAQTDSAQTDSAQMGSVQGGAAQDNGLHNGAGQGDMVQDAAKNSDNAQLGSKTHSHTGGFRDVLRTIVKESENTSQQGTEFEYATRYFLMHDPEWQHKFTQVWMWKDAPKSLTQGKHDTGIDLVAQDTSGAYWAIQAKCYSHELTERNVSTFYMTALGGEYKGLILADTAPRLSSHLQEYLDDAQRNNPDLEFSRVDFETLANSNIDWSPFTKRPEDTRTLYEPRSYQREAIDAVKATFADRDRATIVMACGSGKTLTALRLAEEQCPHGTVLFLAPSISLVNQTMRSWVNQVKGRINLYVVCSDRRAGSTRGKSDEAYGRLSDFMYPVTTDAGKLCKEFSKDDDALNVVFSTYQSISVIHEAQEKGLMDFDLIICDEAHRTAGLVREEGDFQRVHNNDYIHGAKRLYMTATPRVYEPSAKKKGEQLGAQLVASMDDESIYGPIAYYLGFGKAVDLGILTDYKVVVLNVNEEAIPESLQRGIAAGQYGNANGELSMDDAGKYIGVWKALYDRSGSQQIKVLGEHAENDPDSDQALLHHAISFAPTIKDSKRMKDEFEKVVTGYSKALQQEAAQHPDDEGLVREAKAIGDVQGHIKVSVDHVDGGMGADERLAKLRELAADDGVCHILSNARCLSEGIDVPALDAVIYMSSRKSHVDIIQSVGRVMRKAPGKKYGYIILPVFIPAGEDMGVGLASGRYQAVWQVINALRSHDERLNGKINAVQLGDTHALDSLIEVDSVGADRVHAPAKRRHPGTQMSDEESDPHALSGDENGQEGDGNNGSGGDGNGTQGELDLFTEDAAQLGKYIRAEIVKRCGSRIYWDMWTDNVARITANRAEAIAEIIESGKAREGFDAFLNGMKATLNDEYDETSAISVLAQHEVTRPIFQSLFDNPQVVANNPIVQGMDRALEGLYEAGLPRHLEDADRKLGDLYAQIKEIAGDIKDDQAKQNLIKEIYNEFFSKAFKDTAETLGIVYTPVEVVDAQLHMVQRALRREFGTSLGERGVHILDGFAGTGTYMTRLIEDPELISDEDLPYKYEHDLHSNEIVPLASMIMDVNIEQSYHKRMGGDYVPFPGALLTDTFQMSEDGDTIDQSVFTENTARCQEQLATDITVIVGNPPYSSGQKNANDNNKNSAYPTLDHRIAETYLADVDASNVRQMYDHYIRAFRWASDRIGDSGIVCFVSNGGWLTSAAGAGMRRCLVKEFNSIYVYNLRGNQRTQGEESRREGGKIFASGSRATIAITMLVKNPASTEHGVIHYNQVADYMSREDKLKELTTVVKHDPEWADLTPDDHGDWLNQRDDSFYTFIPIALGKGDKGPQGLFSTYSLGVATGMDPWAWDFSKSRLQTRTSTMVTYLNSEHNRLRENGTLAAIEQMPSKKRNNALAKAVRYDIRKIAWTEKVLQTLLHKENTQWRRKDRVGSYRPFCKQHLYFEGALIARPYRQPQLFPYGNAKNIEITTGERGTFITDCIPDLELNHHGQCFPLYWYEPVSAAEAQQLPANDVVEGDDEGDAPESQPAQVDLFGVADSASGASTGASTGAAAKRAKRYIRHDAVTDVALSVFREAYPGALDADDHKAKESIFYYVYGILHSTEYRTRFANNLSKDLPRIPLARDFRAFEAAGRALADLHVHYENVEPWQGVEEEGDSANPGRTEKMRYPQKIVEGDGTKHTDKSVLQVAENLTLTHIPLEAYRYVVNGKSAIDWLIDRYQVRTDKKSGIVNDPNDWSDDPRYIVDLVEKVITVSMRTLAIIHDLPALHELPHTANWPMAWNAGK
ncbi:MAG: DEAD/DEAH box helicase family protein [Bifidobacteriaceae bacterium]|nr:DEAD/DEAH box helicase family protein [Bifidobacteriaceae bacterium]